MRTVLTRNEISNVKVRALRRGIWFSVLTRIERACVDLVIKVVATVRSRSLRRVLSSVLDKLEHAMESQVRLLMGEVGVKLASRLSAIAVDWGNKPAAKWKKDAGFIQYLTITCMNSPS